jgi:hypothetical protein
MAIVARGGNGRIGKLHHAHDFAHMPHGLFDGNGPRLTTGFAALCTHFAIDADQVTGDAQAVETAGQGVHAVALGDTRQVQRNGFFLAHALVGQVDFQYIACDAMCTLPERADLLRIGLLSGRTKAPGIDQITHPNIKRAPGLEADAHGGIQYGQQLCRYGMPLVHRRCIETVQVGVGFPGGHLPVHLIDGCKQGRTYGTKVDVGWRKKHGAVPGAHGFPVQGMALQGRGRRLGRFRRHLHGNVLAL